MYCWGNSQAFCAKMILNVVWKNRFQRLRDYDKSKAMLPLNASISYNDYKQNPVNTIISGQKEVSFQQDGIAFAIPSCCFHFPYRIKPEMNFQIKHPFHPFQVSAIPVTDFPLSKIHFTVCFPISPNISVNACHYLCNSRIWYHRFIINAFQLSSMMVKRKKWFRTSYIGFIYYNK